MAEKKCRALRLAKFKDFIHPQLIKALPHMSTGELKVTGKYPEEEGPFLITFNHLNIEDFPTLGEAIPQHIYALISDEDKNTLSGMAMTMNGVEWVNRLSKEKRQDSAKNVVQILKSGYSCAMCPEATWNLSPNQLIMPMNYGCIRMALEANVKILPVVSFFSNGKRYTTIGEPFQPTENLSESIDNLRDVMGTMLYNQMQRVYEQRYNDGDENITMTEIDGEKYYCESRDKIEEKHWQNYIDSIYGVYPRTKKDPKGVRKYESQFIYTPKTDEHQFFQVFNSVIRKDENGRNLIKRISSSPNGYSDNDFSDESFNDFFGYGYNESTLDQCLEKLAEDYEEEPKVLVKTRNK